MGAREATRPHRRSPLERTKTKHEIAEYMRDRHGIRVDMSTLDRVSAEALRTACEGIEAVIAEFPVAARYITKIGGGARGATVAQVDPDRGILLNPKYYKSQSTLEAAALKDEASGWHPKGAGAVGYTMHEVGHLLNWILIRARIRSEAAAAVLAGGPAPTKRQIEKAEEHDWNNNTTATKIIDRAVAQLQRRRPSATRKGLIRAVSEYAADRRQGDDGEALAECVADYTANREKAKPLSKAVWRLLKHDL